MWDIRPLLTAQFWFNTNPPPLLPFFEKAFFVVAIVALLIAVLLGVIERKQHNAATQKFFEKIRRLATTFGIGELILAFFAYERTPFLSMRFFTLLLGIGMLAWGAMILFWRLRVVPKMQKTLVTQKEFEKYLPR